MKQSRLRKRRVIRFATLYFILLVVFILLFFGPIIVSKFLPLSTFGNIPLELLQPTGQWNNDTFSSVTGSALNGLGDGSGATGGGGGGGGGGASATASSDSGPFTFTGRMAVRWATIA